MVVLATVSTLIGMVYNEAHLNQSSRVRCCNTSSRPRLTKIVKPACENLSATPKVVGPSIKVWGWGR